MALCQPTVNVLVDTWRPQPVEDGEEDVGGYGGADHVGQVDQHELCTKRIVLLHTEQLCKKWFSEMRNYTTNIKMKYYDISVQPTHFSMGYPVIKYRVL